MRAMRAQVSAQGARDSARAARVLTLRSRRAATGALAGSYASAFRGGGLDFEESAPYTPGDDIKDFDWNALARTGEPFIKRFRAERNRLLWIALDQSPSMRFPELTRSKATQGSLCATLLAAAAARVGDRVGFLGFSGTEEARVDARRNASQVWRIARAATNPARNRLPEQAGPLFPSQALRERTRPGAVLVILSDFRDPQSDDPLAAPLSRDARARLESLAERHDVVCGVLEDPLEGELPKVGTLRIADPENPARVTRISTRSEATRAGYERAHHQRRRALAQQIRACGADPFRLSTRHEVLPTLLAFFESRTKWHRRPGRPR